jgi:hypothetical protein
MENKKDPKEQREIDPKSFLRQSKNTPLGQSDREFLATLRGELVHNMKIYPPVETRSPFFSAFSGMLLLPVSAALILILVVGGTAFASQNSLPGDVLYPVKILTEEITVATSLTPQARSQARLSIASQRVQEASKLTERNTDKGNSNTEEFHSAMQSVMNNFDQQVSASLNEGRKLSKKKDSEGALRIANDVKAATSSFNKTLGEARDKGNDKSAAEVDQFINSNNLLNTRAEIQSENSGKGKDDSPDSEQKDSSSGKQNKSDKGSDGDNGHGNRGKKN